MAFVGLSKPGSWLLAWVAALNPLRSTCTVDRRRKWINTATLRAAACKIPRDGRNSAIATQVRVPKSGGMNTTKVNVVRWLKREGEFVKLREPLVELETEKVSYELDSPAEGVLLRIVCPEAAEVPVGEVLCHIGQPEASAAQF
ncbi:MAG TPA: lipoyl domain-containing protein [Terriglobales bacterium]|nr:lipoyl domain-containing protein [Terriglobales bacterium]